MTSMNSYKKGDIIKLPNNFENVFASCVGVYPDSYAWRLSFDNAVYFVRKNYDQFQELMSLLAYEPRYQGFLPY